MPTTQERAPTRGYAPRLSRAEAHPPPSATPLSVGTSTGGGGSSWHQHAPRSGAISSVPSRTGPIGIGMKLSLAFSTLAGFLLIVTTAHSQEVSPPTAPSAVGSGSPAPAPPGEPSSPPRRSCPLPLRRRPLLAPRRPPRAAQVTLPPRPRAPEGSRSDPSTTNGSSAFARSCRATAVSGSTTRSGRKPAHFSSGARDPPSRAACRTASRFY